MFKIENAKELPKQIKEKMDVSDEDDDDNDDDEEGEENHSEKDDEDELRTGSPKILLTAVGIGYHNLTKTLI